VGSSEEGLEMGKNLVIKFSHDYQKLPPVWEGTQAILLGVCCFPMKNLRNRLPQLIRYDTTFRGEDGAYPLDFEDGIILTFFHINTGTLFTTIRRYTPNKYDYYEGCLSETFTLVKAIQ